MSMKINIEKKDFTAHQSISLFICAIGFEERSRFLIESLAKSNSISDENTLCFYFLDNRNDISNDNYIKATGYNISPIDIDKENTADLVAQVSTRINIISNNCDSIKIHVDYSSMPRSWYARLFLLIAEKLREKDSLFFWYSHGDYSSDTKHCTTAGADDFVIFSGKASVHPRNRSHILGLGYDILKPDAIRTVVDPSTLILCYTYPENDRQILDTIHNVHERILNSAAMNISLPIENFNFIVNRIKELVLDLFDKGDVILIPDGPKPLILACSIIPELINKLGIVCFHIKSRNSNFLPENIKPTGIISGFIVNKRIDE